MIGRGGQRSKGSGLFMVVQLSVRGLETFSLGHIGVFCSSGPGMRQVLWGTS